MMYTYTSARDLYGKLTNNTSSANKTTGDMLMEEGLRKMIENYQWPFFERSTTITPVAGQQFYDLPNNVRKVITVTYDVGTTRYAPEPVASQEQWDWINATTGIQGDNPQYFYIFNNQLGLWEIPSSNSNVINVNYIKKTRYPSEADYSTGTITDVTNGAATVTGSGTSWDTTVKAGEYIVIDYPDGDGEWYEIESVDSATQITLTRNYNGVSISGGSATYTVGDVIPLPEDYQIAPVFFGAHMYWLKEGEMARADRFKQLFEEKLREMREDWGNKTTSVVVTKDNSYPEDTQINPNNAIFIQ